MYKEDPAKKTNEVGESKYQNEADDPKYQNKTNVTTPGIVLLIVGFIFSCIFIGFILSFKYNNSRTMDNNLKKIYYFLVGLSVLVTIIGIILLIIGLK